MVQHSVPGHLDQFTSSKRDSGRYIEFFAKYSLTNNYFSSNLIKIIEIFRIKGNFTYHKDFCLIFKDFSRKLIQVLFTPNINFQGLSRLYKPWYKLLKKISKTFLPKIFQSQITKPKTVKLIFICILKPYKTRNPLFSTIYFIIFWWIMFCITNNKMNKHNIYGVQYDTKQHPF